MATELEKFSQDLSDKTIQLVLEGTKKRNNAFAKVKLNDILAPVLKGMGRVTHAAIMEAVEKNKDRLSPSLGYSAINEALQLIATDFSSSIVDELTSDSVILRNAEAFLLELNEIAEGLKAFTEEELLSIVQKKIHQAIDKFGTPKGPIFPKFTHEEEVEFKLDSHTLPHITDDDLMVIHLDGDDAEDEKDDLFRLAMEESKAHSAQITDGDTAFNFDEDLWLDEHFEETPEKKEEPPKKSWIDTLLGRKPDGPAKGRE